jgi:hypothetical protein
MTEAPVDAWDIRSAASKLLPQGERYAGYGLSEEEKEEKDDFED